MHSKIFIYIVVCGLMNFFHTSFGSENSTTGFDIMQMNVETVSNSRSQFDIIKEKFPDDYQEWKMVTQSEKYHILAFKTNPEPQLTPWKYTLIIKDNIYDYDYDIVDDKERSVKEWQYMPISTKLLETMAQSKNVVYLYAYEAFALKKGYEPYLTAKIVKTVVNGVVTDLTEELPQQFSWRRPMIASLFGFTALLIILYKCSS